MQTLGSYQNFPAKVLWAFPGTDRYEVRIEGVGDRLVESGGGGAGGTGAHDQTVYAAGADVWVTIDPSLGGTNSAGAILGTRSTSNRDPLGDQTPTFSAGYPDHVGYRYGEDLTGQLRSNKLKLAHYHRPDTTVKDSLAGDYMKVNAFGGGLGVETFRTWLRGGPMSGIWCHTDDQSTRLAGLTLQTHTLMGERDDSYLGVSGLLIDRRHLWTGSALDDQPPTTLTVEGAAFLGRHTWQLSEAFADGGTTAETEGDGPPVQAGLLHEFRGSNGAYVLRSAHSVSLIRTPVIAPPMERRSLSRTQQAAITAASPHPEDPVDWGPGDIQPPFTSTTAINELDLALQSGTRGDPEMAVAGGETNVDELRRITFMEEIQYLLWRGNLGFDLNQAGRQPNGRWRVSRVPTNMTGQDLDPGVPGTGMWSAQDFIKIPVDFTLPTGKSIEVAKGSQAVTLRPDGSIVLRDAWGSTIEMAGGSITFSAANDLHFRSGRSIHGIAGQHFSMKADQEVELSSNNGRLSLKAEAALQLLGGNGGTGGVLIESRSEAVGFTAGEGNRQRHDGLVLMARRQIAALAPHIRVEASTIDGTSTDPQEDRGTLELLAAQVLTRSAGVQSVQDGTLTIKVADTTRDPDTTADPTYGNSAILLLGPGYVVLPAIYTAATPCVETSPNDQHLTAAVVGAANLATTFSNLTALQGGLVASSLPIMGFTWSTSSQYGVAGAGDYVLVQQPWERAIAATDALGEVWRENYVLSFGRAGSSSGAADLLAPFPGRQAWGVDDQRMVSLGANQWYDLSTETYALAPLSCAEQLKGTNLAELLALPRTTPTVVDGNITIRPT